MNTQENNNNIAAPTVTIAPRNLSKGVLLYVVTITILKSVQAYPCRIPQSAQSGTTTLANRFAADVTKSVR